jgi:hypothetical protein
MSCEALAYADISGLVPFNVNQFYAEKLGYVLLDMAGRSVLELLAFSTVTFMWLDTAIQASPTRGPAVLSLFFDAHTPATFRSMWHNLRRYVLPVLFTVATVLLLLSSIAVSVQLLVHHNSTRSEGDESDPELTKDDPYGHLMRVLSHMPVSRAQVLLEALSWGLHSLVVLQCLGLTAKRICLVSATFPTPGSTWWKRLSLSTKALLPMLVCSFCYGLRCGWLLYQFIGIETSPTTTTDRTTTARFEWAWWIGFMWCPTFVAVAMLLYSARKRDPYLTTNIDTQLRQSLLASPVPPAEAFLAFSRHRTMMSYNNNNNNNSDFCGDDSMFGSPMPHHVIPTQDLEVDEETLSSDSQHAHEQPVEPN